MCFIFLFVSVIATWPHCIVVPCVLQSDLVSQSVTLSIQRYHLYMLFYIIDDYNCIIIILTLLHYNYYFNAGERDSCFINSGVLGSSWAILGRLASSYSRLIVGGKEVDKGYEVKALPNSRSKLHMSSPCFCRRMWVCQPRTRSSWWRL